MNALEDFAGRLRTALAFLPDWLVSVAIFAVAILIALLFYRYLAALLTRMVAHRDLFWRSLVKRGGGALRLASVIFFLWLASNIAPLSSFEADIVRHVLLLGFIALAAVIARMALHIWLTVYLRRFKLDADDNLLARKHVTQSRILERIAITLIIVVAVAAALMTFDGVAQYGISLLASAGAAGIVVGLALQPLLRNIFAGLQLAITQPIRIDDALLIEGEWGNVEEITSTYVVVRIWDWRRLIIPLSYFIEQPFQNWTREGAALIGAVVVYLDYAVPVEEIRKKVEEIVKASANWDKDVVNVQVTDFKEFTAEIRILASARTSGRAFDLRCEIREQLMAFLRSNYPESLPRLRASFSAPVPQPGTAMPIAGGATAPSVR
jgi:small-conductance mechanosensitive channel